jgi:coenzyme F420-reducing hydrogenase delta subunit/ferredoxin
MSQPEATAPAAAPRAQSGAGSAASASAFGETGPRILAIVCNWCTYAGADMAGTTRRVYPATVRMLRVPCSGRANPLLILKAFEQGADGVLVSGCHPGDCHYVQGNYYARRRFASFRALMHFLGLDPRRLHFSWVSASEGIKWAKVVETVSAAVHEVGPLPGFTAETDGSDIRLPEPPAAPRSPDSTEAYEALSQHLGEVAGALLREGRADVVLGYTASTLPGRMMPAMITRAEHVSALAFNERCHHNLATYLAGHQGKTGKVAVVVKACDARAVASLLQETKVRREDVTLIGMSCAGSWTDGSLAPKCYACDGEVAAICDFTVTADGAKPGAVKSGARRAVAPDPRDAQIAYLESLTPARRWAFWQSQFAECLRCYACRAVCPLCYCGTCIAEQHRPQWIPTSIDARGNTAWNTIRAHHLAGRCIGCDECARVCPARIRLDLINRRVAQEVEARFGYRAGESVDAAPPLAAFRADDAQEFIY